MTANDQNLTQFNYNNKRNVLAAHEIQGELNNQGAGRTVREQGLRHC